jgi:hypothetical protein
VVAASSKHTFDSQGTDSSGRRQTDLVKGRPKEAA